VRIAIIGSGFSGLFSAYKLSEKHEVTVYEKSGQIGGLCSGFEVDGQYIDKYNHFFSRNDKELLNLITDLGLGPRVVWKSVKQCLVSGGKIQDLSGLLGLLLFNKLNLIDKFRLAMFLMDNSNSNIDISLNNKTAADWIIEKCGMNVYKHIFRPLLSFKTQKFEDVSAMYLKARIKEKKNNVIGGIDGGIRSLVIALRDKIHKNRGNIWLNSKVKKVLHTDGGSWQVILDQGAEEYDLVVCCIPINEAAALFITNPGFPKAEYLNVGCWTATLSQPINKDFWICLVDDQESMRHVLVNTYPINGENIVYFPFYLRGQKIDDEVGQQKKKIFYDCLSLIKKDFNPGLIQNEFFNFDEDAEPVFTQRLMDGLYQVVEPFKGFYLSDLVYVPSILKTINTALKRSADIRQRIFKDFKA
jgi:protoporphyrinogen oxidase